MTTGMTKQQLREIVRAKMNLIEKERAEFHRFRQLLAQEDMEVYLRVVHLWEYVEGLELEQEQEETSS